jgi:hypothetical protein
MNVGKDNQHIKRHRIYVTRINKYMEPDKTQKKPDGQHEHPLPSEISREQKVQSAAAHDQAERDMENDAELTAHNPNDDLDEGETARLGENTTDLV